MHCLPLWTVIKWNLGVKSSVSFSAGNVWQNAPPAAVLQSVVLWLLRSPCPASLYTVAVE